LRLIIPHHGGRDLHRCAHQRLLPRGRRIIHQNRAGEAVYRWARPEMAWASPCIRRRQQHIPTQNGLSMADRSTTATTSTKTSTPTYLFKARSWQGRLLEVRGGLSLELPRMWHSERPNRFSSWDRIPSWWRCGAARLPPTACICRAPLCSRCSGGRLMVYVSVASIVMVGFGLVGSSLAWF
jgi:hypothetical protein